MSPQKFSDYPRDLRGYGRNPPDPRWPNSARVAVQFVLNYEEGGENCILHGDPASEAFLSDVLGAQPWPGQRHMNVESMYEYGARAGFWRLWRLFVERRLPVTVFGVASALARNLDVVAAMREAHWEIASHGLKWIDYKDIPEDEERAHMQDAIRIHREVTGDRPLGWYTGRNSVHTLKLVLDDGGFLYSSDSYAVDPVGQVVGIGKDRISSCLTRSMPTTCGSSMLRASAMATRSSLTCATPSIFSMTRARAPRK